MIKTFLSLFIGFFIVFNCNAQTLDWIPLEAEKNYGVCMSQTNPSEHVQCFGLAYTPIDSGYLYSYTTGFFIPCQEGNSNLTTNKSCFLTDNSGEINGCAEAGKILFNASGNSGSLENTKLQAGRQTIIHQVCFMVEHQKQIAITLDEITGATLSIIAADQKDIKSSNVYLEPFYFECTADKHK